VGRFAWQDGEHAVALEIAEGGQAKLNSGESSVAVPDFYRFGASIYFTLGDPADLQQAATQRVFRGELRRDAVGRDTIVLREERLGKTVTATRVAP
jgi:hypothetical protein